MVDPQGFEIVASSLRADSRDLETFVEVLATKLAGALPTQTAIDRRGGLFSRDKRVRRIQVALGDSRYDLVADGPHLETSRAKAVRGIVLKNEPLPLDEWIDSLSRDLAQAASSSEQARLALERLLNQ
ncbi:MAG TPA: hypothetical protein VKX16_02195 [Chloroflexota bacterium]|nr:hypothetical protein [Chloroflexota bacterium]